METIYIEQDIRNHKKTRQILSLFPKTRIIDIHSYSEVFNRKNQDFEKQKKYGKILILAKKRKNFIMPNPDYCPSEVKKSFYFSTLYNCPYDCEYCFLQGLFRSAYYVFFINYEDFQKEILKKIKKQKKEKIHFFSGYDNDSLALESITSFAKHFIPWFSRFPHASLELRTKSANIDILKKLKPTKNAIIAWTLSPTEVQRQWEHRTPSLESRIKALNSTIELGWKVGIRLDPLIHFDGWEESYNRFFDFLETKIPLEKIKNIYCGFFRLPVDFFKKMKKMNPRSTLLTKYFELDKNGQITYSKETQKKMSDFVLVRCQKLMNNEKIAVGKKYNI